LLIGAPSRVNDVMPAANRSSSSRTRYEIDPGDHFRAIRRARMTGHNVIGCYHSHPAGRPVPSHCDLAGAFAGFLFVIVGLEEAENGCLSAWEYVQGNFVQIALVRTP